MYWHTTLLLCTSAAHYEYEADVITIIAAVVQFQVLFIWFNHLSLL